MFCWDNCPPELFDLYIEVGEVKESEVKDKDCVYIEVWLASFFNTGAVRQECARPVRRPIYGVIKQIRKLSGGRPVCLILMCDDNRDDTLLWAVAIRLLLKYLQPSCSLLYIRKTRQETEEFVRNLHVRREEDRKVFQNLETFTTATLYSCPNRYTPCTENALPPQLQYYVNCTKQEA